jgi:hypothetical protein
MFCCFFLSNLLLDVVFYGVELQTDNEKDFEFNVEVCRLGFLDCFERRLRILFGC